VKILKIRRKKCDIDFFLRIRQQPSRARAYAVIEKERDRRRKKKGDKNEKVTDAMRAT